MTINHIKSQSNVAVNQIKPQSNANETTSQVKPQINMATDQIKSPNNEANMKVALPAAVNIKRVNDDTANSLPFKKRKVEIKTENQNQLTATVNPSNSTESYKTKCKQMFFNLLK